MSNLRATPALPEKSFWSIQDAIEALKRQNAIRLEKLKKHGVTSERVDQLTQPKHEQELQQKYGEELEETIDTLVASLAAELALDSARAARLSKVAHKVFGVVDLSEKIFSFLPADDVLRLQRVCTLLNNIIRGSNMLPNVAKCGMRIIPPHPDSLAETLVTRELPIVLIVHALMDGREDTSQTFDPRIGSMLVCQPPITAMRLYVTCRWHRNIYQTFRDSEPPARVIGSDRGIRMHQIIAAIEEVRAEHRLCPQALPNDHKDNRDVVHNFSIQGSVVLNENDPDIEELRDPGGPSVEERFNEGLRRRERMLVRLEIYCDAKRQAHDDGRPIPTFAEFEAAQAA